MRLYHIHITHSEPIDGFKKTEINLEVGSDRVQNFKAVLKAYNELRREGAFR